MTVKVNSVSPASAQRWLSHGWALFREQSGLWIQCGIFLMLLAYVAISSHQLFGLLHAFIMPFLSASFYHMAFNAHHGVKSRFGDLFKAFGDPMVRGPFIQLAAFGVLMSLAVSPLTESITNQWIEQKTLDGERMALVLAYQAFVQMFMLFAVPVIYFFHEKNLLVAMKLSFFGCLRNLLPLLLLAFMAMALVVLCSITMGLLFVVVIPWLMIALFAAFHEIFESDLPKPDLPDSPDDETTFTV